MSGRGREVEAVPDQHTVEVWSAPVTADARFVERARSALSTDERERADRGVGAVRTQRILRRYWLRVVVGDYLGLGPESVELRHGAFGKPRLAAPSRLHFSATGTDSQVFVAVAGAPVGIDAESVFVPRRDVRPLRAWTVQEALAKALGCGLGHDVPIDVGWEGERPVLRQIGYDDPAHWSVQTLRTGGLIATIAVRTPAAAVRFRELPRHAEGVDR